MRVLVTGGSGVVGKMAVTALIARGHAVRLLSRHAEADAAQWPRGVEARNASVADAGQIRGAATGCDAVLHVAGIVAESPPDVTFVNTNVEGTRNLLRETERAKVGRFLYVSSLGADRGASEYHRSKYAAENLVREFPGVWIILRPANVYGPGDEVISLLLKMMRTLPVIPFVGSGDQPFQPLWADDLGEALAQAVERTDLKGRVLELAGGEETSVRDVLDRFEKITGKSPPRLRVPQMLAGPGARAAEMLGLELPVTAGQLQMMEEGSVIANPLDNALIAVFHITPTPLDTGLRMLADVLPPKLPSDGIGAFTRKRFWADIVGSPRDAQQTMTLVCTRFADLCDRNLDVGAEPDTPVTLTLGTTITMAVPLRGTIQVRVEELTETAVTMVTLQGHPLAGAVRFAAKDLERAVRFEVAVFSRAANFVDWVALAMGGSRLQNATWTHLVEEVVEQSGGTAPEGVETETTELDDADRERVERWLQELVNRESRETLGAKMQ